MSRQEIGKGRTKDGGEFGQCLWSRDLRGIDHCVSGSRLCSPASRRGPGAAPETLLITGEADSARQDAWCIPKPLRKLFSWRCWVRLASLGIPLPLSQSQSPILHFDPDPKTAARTPFVSLRETLATHLSVPSEPLS